MTKLKKYPKCLWREDMIKRQVEKEEAKETPEIPPWKPLKVELPKQNKHPHSVGLWNLLKQLAP